MRRRPDPIVMPEDVFSADSIVPPVPIITVDAMLAFVSREASLIDRRIVIDMLLDIRNALWQTNDYSTAIAPLLDKAGAS